MLPEIQPFDFYLVMDLECTCEQDNRHYPNGIIFYSYQRVSHFFSNFTHSLIFRKFQRSLNFQLYYLIQGLLVAYQVCFKFFIQIVDVMSTNIFLRVSPFRETSR
jgi:hypothetical protein